MILEILQRPKLSGIYHYAGADALSRYDMARRIAEHFGLNPDEFVEPFSRESDVDLTLDTHALISRVKTRAPTYNELLEEMQVPEDLRGWLKEKSGRLPVRRFKL